MPQPRAVRPRVAPELYPDAPNFASGSGIGTNTNALLAERRALQVRQLICAANGDSVDSGSQDAGSANLREWQTGDRSGTSVEDAPTPTTTVRATGASPSVASQVRCTAAASPRQEYDASTIVRGPGTQHSSGGQSSQQPSARVQLPREAVRRGRTVPPWRPARGNNQATGTDGRCSDRKRAAVLQLIQAATMSPVEPANPPKRMRAAARHDDHPLPLEREADKAPPEAMNDDVALPDFDLTQELAAVIEQSEAVGTSVEQYSAAPATTTTAHNVVDNSSDRSDHLPRVGERGTLPPGKRHRKHDADPHPPATDNNATGAAGTASTAG